MNQHKLFDGNESSVACSKNFNFIFFILLYKVFPQRAFFKEI